MSDTSTPSRQKRLSAWRLLAWAGPAYCILEALSWGLVAGFLPPPMQSWSAVEVHQFYLDHNFSIRLGMMMTLFFAPLYYIWSTVVSKLMARVEGPDSVFSTIELLGGFATVIVTFGACCAFLSAGLDTAAKSPQDIKAINDLGWMWFNPTAMVTVFQMTAFGLAFLQDRRKVPLMPRWLSWFSFAMVGTLLVALFTPFFNRGPFAWHGLLTYYVGLGGYFVWIAVVCRYVFGAIRQVEKEG